jgi:ribosome-binding protein aMBF1 (putative translation factor)
MIMKSAHVPLKKVLQKKLKDPQFKFHFDESRSISDLCLAVARARQSLGLSQEELAKRIDSTQSVVARLENGNQGRMPSLDLLNRIAVALNLSLVVGFESKKVA